MTVSNSQNKVNDNKRRFRQKPKPVGWNKGRWSHTYGAVDLGTNNCRLLVAKPESRSFRVIDSFSRIVRLGEGVSQSGQLSEAAIDRTIEALAICADKMDRRGVSRMRCVATEVCRKAANSADFLDRVRAEVGIELDIISTEEEAKLALNGCSPLLDYRNKYAIVFDIGGGSTELVWLRLGRNRQNTIMGWTSIPYGVVSLTEKHGDVSVSPAAYEGMIADVAEHVKTFEEAHHIFEEIKKGRVQMLGTSGTVTTLAGVLFGLPRYNRRRVDGAWLQTPKILKICDRLARSDYAARASEPCIGDERADLVVSGCAIVQAMYNTWPVRKIRVADRGVREGLLLGLMTDADKEMEQPENPAPQIAEKLI